MLELRANIILGVVHSFNHFNILSLINKNKKFNFVWRIMKYSYSFFFNRVENPSRKSYIFYYIYFINILLNIIEIKITLLR